jgi:chloramphenicol 3-O-phosphotransferase
MVALPGRVIVITGIMAAGKSTVAQALAERLPQSVHLRGDLFRRMIVNGQAEVTPETWEAAEGQLHLRQKLATDVAKTYADNGYAVCYQDVILGADLGRVVAILEPAARPVYVVVLSPSPEVATQRDETRHKTGYGSWTAVALDHSLQFETPRIGFWIDTSALSIDESVDTILAHFDAARI